MSASTTPTIVRTSTVAPDRRIRRLRAYGPRCPQCAGPLVFGEGCSLCPICGHSSCAV